MEANSQFTILGKPADSSEDAHKMLVLEAQIAGADRSASATNSLITL
jgi:hypothetical protein